MSIKKTIGTLQPFLSQFFLLFDRKQIPIIKEKITAAETPALAAHSPPVTAPKSPFSAPCIAPLASKYPKPDMGTVAPVPAYSTIGWYKPSDVRSAPAHTKITKIRAGVSFVLSIKI